MAKKAPKFVSLVEEQPVFESSQPVEPKKKRKEYPTAYLHAEIPGLDKLGKGVTVRARVKSIERRTGEKTVVGIELLEAGTE